MATNKKSIAAIITCHNRKAKTLNCLDKLFNQNCIDNIDLTVYLVDDGSTDGTTQAIRKKYPQVNILQGDGTLYWNGGMRLAFAAAIKQGYDYYLWLNDDTFIYHSAIKSLMEATVDIQKKDDREIIVTGTIKEIDSGEINYGGRNRISKWKPLYFVLINDRQQLQECDTFNGNIVLIPQAVVSKIGNISPQFSKQHGGDFDYGLRAKYAGFSTWVAPGIIGECASNKIEGSLFDKNLSLSERLKKMKSPQGAPPAKEWMIFSKRHAGYLWPYYWFRTTIRVIFPWSYLLLRKPQEDSVNNKLDH